MKHLLITIAAVLLVGCGPPVPDVSIYDAVEDGNIAVVKEHLAAGTDVNSKDKDGWTPLHEAASEGHNKIIELLVAKGADVNAKGADGETPVDAASKPRDHRLPPQTRRQDRCGVKTEGK